MAAFMPHVDFGWSLVATAPSPATSGTSLTVTAGQGVNFPDPAVLGTYIATICPANALPTWANSEEVLVTAKATDNFTITRTQGGTSARTVVVGDQFFIGPVAKVIKDIEAALDNSVCDFRLTLTSGTPVTEANVTGATTIYCTPTGKGNRIGLYNSTASAWLWDSSAEFSIALGTLVNAQAYDVFCFDNAGVPTLELLEWANGTVTMTIASPAVVTWTGHGMTTGMSITFTTSGALPTGVSANTQYFITRIDANTFKLSTSRANVSAATFINTSGTQSGTHTGHQPQARQTALVLQDGVLVKSGATSRRFLGSFMTTSTTTTEDSDSKRLLYNHYNRVRKRFFYQETGSGSWTYTTATTRQANANAANRVDVLVGWSDYIVNVVLDSLASNTSTGVLLFSAIGLDDTANPAAANVQGTLVTQASVNAMLTPSLFRSSLSVGYHALIWLENSTATGTTTWFGTGNSLLHGDTEA